MPLPTTVYLRDHVAAAKQILWDLNSHTVALADAIGQTDGAVVLSAVEERARLLDELQGITESLARTPEWQKNGRAAFNELLVAANAALESQDLLAERTLGERNRLATALRRVPQRDAVADRYAVAGGTAARSLSVAV